MRNLKRALSLALASVMLLGMMVVGTSAASYKDVDSKDNLEAIEVLKMVGIMTGDDKGNFNPDKMVTRNEMAVVMCNLLGLKTGGTHPFTDVPAWAAPYVAACYNNGIIAGVSATQFNGDANVTAVQAGLMLMKALGYFGYAGEFGDSWKLSVVKQADKINLYDGINASTDQVMTRNEIAKMVLNALECTVQVVTEQGGVSVDGNGISVNVKPTYKYEDAANNSGKDYAGRTYGNGTVENTMQLCEKIYGSDLKKDTTANSNNTDDFGRPATKWTYNNDSITCPDAPDAVYTVEVKGKTVYADLGKPSNVKPVIAKEDGKGYTASGFEIASGNNGKIGGNGVLTEVYYNKDTKTATIILINTYVDTVVDCDKNDDGKYDIKLSDTNKKFESDVAYENDDVVIYTATKKANGDVDEIKSMAMAQKVEGEVTYVKAGDSFKVAGTTYKYNKAVADGDKLTSSAVDGDTKVYLDSYGYVIKIDEASENTNYAVVMATTKGSWTGTDVDEQAKLFFADGTVKAVDVKSLTGIAAGDLVTYTVNSKSEYDLTKVQSAADASSALKIEKGKATITYGNDKFTANSKTVFFVYNSDSKTYEAYTGIKNVASISVESGYQVAWAKNGKLVKAVYLTAGKDIKDGSKSDVGALFVFRNAKFEKDTDLGDYYEVKAIVDGKTTKVKVDAALVGENKDFQNTDSSTTAKAYVVTKITTNDDGIVTSVTKESAFTIDKDGDGYMKVTSIKAVKDEVITLNDTAYSYSDNVTVYEYDISDNDFSAKSIKSVKSNDSIADGQAFAQVDDNVVIALYYMVP